jgi:hypothetical protein
LKEALEANDWESNELGDALGLEDFEDDEAENEMGFGAEAAELNMEMFGVKQAIHDIGEEDEVVNQDEEVEKLQAMMQRMQAVRGEFSFLVKRCANELRHGGRHAGGRKKKIRCQSC